MHSAYSSIVERARPPAGWHGCDASAADTLRAFYAQGYAYAKAGQHFLDRVGRLPSGAQRIVWHKGPRPASFGGRLLAPANWFGPYSAMRLVTVARTFDSVVERFEKGYPIDGRFRPVRFECLPSSAAKCRSTVLANASVFGVARICPRLLAKPVASGGAVVLHELLHQALGVGDQRHQVCRRGNESRCYRAGALRLVSEGHTDVALRNNDNYVYFARALYQHRDRRGAHPS